MTTPQELLNEINAADFPSLYEPQKSTKERKAGLKLARQKLRHIKGLSKQEKDFIKARWDNRDKAQAMREQLELLPYLAMDRYISQIEVDLATLESAIESGSSIPEALEIGKVLMEERQGDTITYKIVSQQIADEMVEQAQQRSEEERQQKLDQQQQQLAQAKQMIQQKRYREARDILNQVDHPTAQQWLDKLKPIIEKEYEAEVRNNFQVNIVCPKCGTQTRFPYFAESANLTCPVNTCKATFRSEWRTIRAKRSRSNKKAGRRYYSVRIQGSNGGEQLIEFSDSWYNPEIELRAKDSVIFTTFEDHIQVVQNITLGVFYQVKPPSSCYIATYIYGEESLEVSLLRAFRDKHLVSSNYGRNFVAIYYTISPKIIQLLGGSKTFRSAAKLLVDTVLLVISRKWH